MAKLTQEDIFQLASRTYSFCIDYMCDSNTDIIAWKAGYYREKETPILIKLMIPKDALRTHYKDKEPEKYCKHRCSKAKVLGFYSYYTGKELKSVDKAHSMVIINGKDGLNTRFEYRKGTMVYPDTFCTELSVCSNGIHYFNNKQSAFYYMDSILGLSDHRIRRYSHLVKKFLNGGHLV